MATQQIYFDNPNTINSINSGVNSLQQSTVVRTVQNTQTDYVKAFMTGTIVQYPAVKMFGAVAGQVNPESDFTFTTGYQSVIFSTGAPGGNGTTAVSNLSGVAVNGPYSPDATLIAPVNPFGETLASTSVVPFSTGSYFIAGGGPGKPYAAAILGALVDRGIIRLNDPVIKYFPNWRYMKVVQQKFFSNGNAICSATGLNGSLPTVINGATGVIDIENQVVTLTDGRVGTIRSFMDTYTTTYSYQVYTGTLTTYSYTGYTAPVEYYYPIVGLTGPTGPANPDGTVYAKGYLTTGGYYAATGYTGGYYTATGSVSYVNYTGGAASSLTGGNLALRNFIIKVDKADLPTWKQGYVTNGASSTGSYPYFLTSNQYKFPYYLEVQPIQVQDTKTYGTVQMAFSHQLGLGFAAVSNQNIGNALRDKGVMYTNINIWNPPGGAGNVGAGFSGTLNTAVLDANYNTANAYYPGGTGGYTLNTWANEIVSAGLLSTHPGKVWEYDNSLMFGLACCEIAYQQYYNLPYIKPYWQIGRELIDIPLGIDNLIYHKAFQMGTGTATTPDLLAQRAVRDKFTGLTSTAGGATISGLTGTVQHILLRQPGVAYTTIDLTNMWNTSLGIHDLSTSININVWSLEGMKRFAYMLANYGVAKNGTRILSKNFVKLMCETNFLPANLSMYYQDEKAIEQLADRNSTPGVFSIYENIGFGLGGLVGQARPGKSLACVTDYPSGWYSWAGAFGSELWVNPTEGKYIVVFYRHNGANGPSSTSGSGQYSTATTYLTTANTPASYETYGLDALLSTFTY